jgi:hypothetical protein
VASALSEAKLVKSVDVFTAAQICSILHQRHPEFIGNFLPPLLRVLPGSDGASTSSSSASDSKSSSSNSSSSSALGSGGASVSAAAAAATLANAAAAAEDEKSYGYLNIQQLVHLWSFILVQISSTLQWNCSFCSFTRLTVRRRGALRLLAELFLCGVIAETATILVILKNLVWLSFVFCFLGTSSSLPDLSARCGHCAGRWIGFHLNFSHLTLVVIYFRPRVIVAMTLPAHKSRSLSHSSSMPEKSFWAQLTKFLLHHRHHR